MNVHTSRLLCSSYASSRVNISSVAISMVDPSPLSTNTNNQVSFGQGKMEPSVKASVHSKRKPPATAAPSSSSSNKRRRRQPPPPVAEVSKPRPKLSTKRAITSDKSATLRPKPSKPVQKTKKPKAVEQLTLFSRYADPSVQSPKPVRPIREMSYVSDYNPTGATLLETPPSRRLRQQQQQEAAIPLTANGGAEGVVDLASVTKVGDLEMVEGDDILHTLMRRSTPRVKRKFPSEEALTDSEQRDRDVLRRQRLKLRSQFSVMKEEQTQNAEVRTRAALERNLFQSMETREETVEEERVKLEEEEAETDEETTESKINRLSKVMHMNWKQFFLRLVSGALLLCAMVVATPFVKKLLEPPLPYCDSEWIEENEGSFVLADPADHFDRSKALQPFVSSSAMATRGTVCQPCPVYGSCLNSSVISCAPPYVLQYGLCKESPEVQQNLEELALSIQKFVVEKAARNACENLSLWSYLNSDDEAEPRSGLSASIEVLLSDVQVFVTRTISFGKVVARLPREYAFNRALDMALRDLKDIFVTEDQRQLVVGGGVVPWSCHARHQLYSYVKLIALAVALGTALAFGYRQFLLYRTERELVDRFVKEVRFFLLDRTRRPDRFYPADHLRDDLFEKQSLQDRAWLRKSVWPKVAAVVKDDSRISTRVMRVRGEDMVVWEWASSSSPAHRRAGGNRGRGFRPPPRPQKTQNGSRVVIAAPVRRRKKTNQMSVP